jgi:hypothetical protein
MDSNIEDSERRDLLLTEEEPGSNEKRKHEIAAPKNAKKKRKRKSLDGILDENTEESLAAIHDASCWAEQPKVSASLK